MVEMLKFNSIQFNSIQFNSIQFNSIQFNLLIYETLFTKRLTAPYKKKQRRLQNNCNTINSSVISNEKKTKLNQNFEMNILLANSRVCLFEQECLQSSENICRSTIRDAELSTGHFSWTRPDPAKR